jgi:hypothetical protein
MSTNPPERPAVDRLQDLLLGEPEELHTASCPTAEQLAAAVAGELPRPRFDEVLDHVGGCAACAREWRLAADLGRIAIPLAGGRVVAAVRPVGTVFPVPKALAAAAMVVLAVGTGLLITGRDGRVAVPGFTERGPSPVDGPDRGTPEAPADEAAERVRSLVPESVPLPRTRALLRWTPAAGAKTYDVTVWTRDLVAVAQGNGLSVPEYLLPEEALAGLPPGADLVWQVQVRREDGSRRGSKLFHTSLD